MIKILILLYRISGCPCGIDGEQLIKTVEAYNAMCENGQDTEFGKEDPVALKEGIPLRSPD